MNRISDVESQPLNGGSPRRLSNEAGRWVLEVIRHVNLGQGLIRPTTQRLSGHRVITSYFRNNPDHAPLGKAAERLMQGDSSREPRSYTALGSDWVASSMAPGPGELLESSPALGRALAQDTQLDGLRAQLVLLTAVQEGLLMRVARLEARLARAGVPRAPVAGLETRTPGPASRSSDEVEGAQSGEPSSVPGSSEGPRAWTPTEEARSEGPADLASAEAVAAPPSVVAAQPEERVEIELPEAAELAHCVASLMGGDVTLTEAAVLAVNRTTKDCYCAGLLDETDRAVGLILMDLQAVVYLGGTLMMLPASELEQQLQTQSPGEDSLAASAEICSAVSAAINQLRRQPLRLAGLEKFEFRSWGWVTEPALRRDLQDSLGGRLTVLSRPAPTAIF